MSVKGLKKFCQKFLSAKGKSLKVPAAHPYPTLHRSVLQVSSSLTFYYASFNIGG